jgi:mannose/fructose/N-acetylgalactosamine-specific phosphotransferase system component IID
MYLVAIAWIYVVLMMSIVEATASNGSVLGAVITFALYGALPLSIVLYVMGTPHRRRARLAAEAAETLQPQAGSAAQPDAGGHAAADPVPAERKEA